ncbi:MAG: 2Fe-2S iron-sulfur cluster-binding protein, partial [Myxococcota bacterium]
MELLLTIGAATAVFAGVILVLVALLLVARQQLVPQGQVTIGVNGDPDKALQVQPGQTLLSALSDQKIFIPSACGGGGTCAMCKCQVIDGGGDILPTETGHIKLAERKENWRLACQVKVKQDMGIRVPDSVFSVGKWECEVVSNDNVATVIKEFKVRLPKGKRIDFVSGDYIQIEIPQYELDYKDFDIEEQYRGDWD